SLELSPDFGFELLAYARQEKERYPGTERQEELTAPIHERRDPRWVEHGFALTHREVQAHAEARIAARSRDGVGRERRTNQQTRRGQDAVAISLFDRFVHRQREPEVVPGDDHALGHGSLCASAGTKRPSLVSASSTPRHMTVRFTKARANQHSESTSF